MDGGDLGSLACLDELETNYMVTLVSSEGESISAPADDLSSKSGYFRSCLRSGMKESLSKTITFANLSTATLKNVVGYIQISECPVTLSNVGALLFSAGYLQMAEFHDYCCAWLIKTINLQNYLAIYSVAESFSLSQVLTSLRDFMLESLSEFSVTDQFSDMSADQLIEILESDQLSVVSEREVFESLVLWLENHKSETRKDASVAQRLLRAVRIPSFYTEQYSEIEQVLSSINVSDDGKSEFLTKLKYYQNHPHLCHLLLKEHQLNVRKGENVIMTLGGVEQGIWKKQPSNKTKFVMTSSLPDTAETDLDCPTEPFVLYDKHTSRVLRKLYEHSVCVIDNFLYLAGGQTTADDSGEFATGDLYRFDPRVFEWTELCAMSTCRSLFYLGAVEGKLYAIGGANKVGVDNTVERYIPENNQWIYMKPLTTKIHEHAGCVTGDRIFISGGHNDEMGTIDKLWCFNPEQDDWQTRAPLLTARSNHAMVAMKTKLFVFGGCQIVEESAEDIWECESYDTETDQWTVLTTLPRLSSCLTATLVGNSILCLGGYTFSFSKYVDMVQVYNTNTNSWKTYKLHMNVPKCFVCEQIVVNEMLLYKE